MSRVDYYDDEKHGELNGSAIDNEILDSSSKILAATPFGAKPGEKKSVGLQQWFTPEPIAKFAAALLGPSTPVLDFTAGSGAMMQHFLEGYRFGIEIDKAHVDKTKALGIEGYTAIHGDAQKLIPMMRAIDMHFFSVAINPPFGLKWKDRAHGDSEIPSVKLAYLWAQDILHRSGHGLMLCDQDDLARNVLNLPEAKGIYAIINLEGQVFPGVQTKCALALFVNHHNIKRGYDPADYRRSFNAPKDSLLPLIDDLRRQRYYAASYLYDRGFHPSQISTQVGDNFKALQTEYTRRKTLSEKGKTAIKNDLELKGKKVHVYLNPYARQLLAQKGDLTGIELLHNQPINYFATNVRDWQKASAAEQKRLITIGDPLKEAVANVLAQVKRTTTPLFEVKRTMRLGWLEDVHNIKCTRSDSERGFSEGHEYRIKTAKQVLTEEFEEPREDKKKKRKVLRQYRRQRKLLQVVIQTNFDKPLELNESSANIDYLEKHFDIPDPGDVATLFPEEYEANKKLLLEIEEEFRANDKVWHAANEPDEPYRPFRFKFYQLDHMARLLIKERGLLAHEQGLGKTVMQLALKEALIRKGAAKRKTLTVTPQDLIPQWQEQTKRFTGQEMQQISTVKHAHQAKRHLQGKRAMKKRTWIPAAEDSEHGGGHWQIQKRGNWITKPQEAEYITHYEALSRVGRKYEELPVQAILPITRLHAEKDKLIEAKKIVSEHNRLHKIEDTPAQHRKKLRAEMNRMDTTRLTEESMLQAMVEADPRKLDRLTYAQVEKLRDKPATTKFMCPRCRMDTSHGWTGEVCRDDTHKGHFGCGYVHRRRRYKSGYAALTSCFIDGVICADEISEIRGHSSQRSQSLRALARGPHKFGATGTPLSNYVNDCFWGLWWCLGNSSLAFPYDYAGGRAKFEEDFCVVEWLLGEKGTSKAGQIDGNKKVLPMITNVSQFWRLTQPGVSRCRKENTGEPIVDRTYHLIQVPMGMTQKHMQDFTLKQFHHWFEWHDPTHPMVLYELHEKFAMGLGARWWLERTATMPTTLTQLHKPTQEELEARTFWPEPFTVHPPDHENAGERRHPWVDDISDWTPANLKVLQIAIEHAEKGEKVLIGSDLIDMGHWLSERLADKGVRSVHITEDKNGKPVTKTPKKRSKAVRDFTAGDAEVLCTGIAAMKLGHNMDTATTVIVHGLPDSFMFLDQFIARVHRLTSKHPVNVYVVVPEDSLAEKKWHLLKDKGGASDLAFDGELMMQQEEEVDWEEILKQMKQKGVHFDGSEIHEADVEEQWENVTFTPPKTRTDRSHRRSLSEAPRQKAPEKTLEPLTQASTPPHSTKQKAPEKTLEPQGPTPAGDTQSTNGHHKATGGLLSRLGIQEPSATTQERTGQPNAPIARKKRRKVKESMISEDAHKAKQHEKNTKQPGKKSGTVSMFDFSDEGDITYEQHTLL